MTTRHNPGLLVYGAGGHAKFVHDVAVKSGAYSIAAYIVDYEPGHDESLLGAPIRSFEQIRDKRSALPNYFVVAIGDNELRRAKTRLMQEAGFEPATLIHPTATIGYGSVVGAGSILGPQTVIDVDAELGEGSLLNVKAAVGHETCVGDFCHISAGAMIGARSTVGSLVFAGMGAILLSGVNVGDRSFLAAGALVTKHVPDNMLAIGMPARFRAREPQIDAA